MKYKVTITGFNQNDVIAEVISDNLSFLDTIVDRVCGPTMFTTWGVWGMTQHVPVNRWLTVSRDGLTEAITNGHYVSSTQ